MEIVELSQRPAQVKEAINYFWKCWGNTTNFSFYEDCITHSLAANSALPKFYLALDEQQIVGSYALLVNDIISRQDLMPWFACLHVNEDRRGQGLAAQLLEHGRREAHHKGFAQLYLSSDLENFYERKGWSYFGKGFNVFGDAIKIYSVSTT